MIEASQDGGHSDGRDREAETCGKGAEGCGSCEEDLGEVRHLINREIPQSSRAEWAG